MAVLFVRVAAALLFGTMLMPQEPQQPASAAVSDRRRAESPSVDPYRIARDVVPRDDFGDLRQRPAPGHHGFSSGMQPIRAVVLVDTSASMMPVIELARRRPNSSSIRRRPDDRAKAGLFTRRSRSDGVHRRSRQTAGVAQGRTCRSATRTRRSIDQSGGDRPSIRNRRRVVIVLTDDAHGQRDGLVRNLGPDQRGGREVSGHVPAEIVLERRRSGRLISAAREGRA